MSDTLFKQVNYDLDSLTKFIELGQIGLPDIQRPFVWPNKKVRDLFDSMYRGYPVGYLLFWQNGFSAESNQTRQIGTDQKQKVPNLLIVDGQQRLTSLFAVTRGIKVLRKIGQAEAIQIAFNPLNEEFAVADAAIRKDKAFIPNISVLWASDASLFEIVGNYLNTLRESREVTAAEQQHVEKAITRLFNLPKFPFTALELSTNIDEEQVAEVFVRINSKGKSLNQADFILTLMSVFWDEGRRELEDFCLRARQPSTGSPSPFNHYIQPDPDQLLRVSIALGFKRARLQYVYSILRGKDLETGEFSDERREHQFGVLKDAQAKVLNLSAWHDYFHVVRAAGYLGGRMITSNNNLLFSYAFYLIGCTEYAVPPNELRRVIARWFFMCSLTGRYTGSPESDLEFDLARLRDVHDAAGFVRTLDQVCDAALTSDFWSITLPNDLATLFSKEPFAVRVPRGAGARGGSCAVLRSKGRNLAGPVRPLHTIGGRAAPSVSEGISEGGRYHGLARNESDRELCLARMGGQQRNRRRRSRSIPPRDACASSARRARAPVPLARAPRRLGGDDLHGFPSRSAGAHRAFRRRCARDPSGSTRSGKRNQPGHRRADPRRGGPPRRVQVHSARKPAHWKEGPKNRTRMSQDNRRISQHSRWDSDRRRLGRRRDRWS